MTVLLECLKDFFVNEFPKSKFLRPGNCHIKIIIAPYDFLLRDFLKVQD